MNQQQPNQMQAQNIPASDQVNKNKSIYDVPTFEVFWRNFIAGVGRALGGIFIYIVIFYGVFSLVSKYAMPQIMPLVGSLQNSIDSLNQLNSSGSQNQVVDQVLSKPDLQNILNQVKK